MDLDFTPTPGQLYQHVSWDQRRFEIKHNLHNIFFMASWAFNIGKIIKSGDSEYRVEGFEWIKDRSGNDAKMYFFSKELEEEEKRWTIENVQDIAKRKYTAIIEGHLVDINQADELEAELPEVFQAPQMKEDLLIEVRKIGEIMNVDFGV